MSTRRTKPGGWVQREKQPCRWCGGAVQGRRVTFCSAACVHEWRLRTDPSYLREQVFARDRGVCAVCGTDTETLRKGKRKLDWRSRREFEREWGGRRNLWDADHIVPVVEGGGECDLSNMRTLCLKCHQAATAELRKRRRSRKSHGMADASKQTEANMPGKKAHKPRIVENAGIHGVHRQAAQGRRSAEQIEGQAHPDWKGRRGQFGGAGDAPLTKK